MIRYLRKHQSANGAPFRDTVASVGLIYGRNLPFTAANSAVRVFRHALSLDEVPNY